MEAISSLLNSPIDALSNAAAAAVGAPTGPLSGTAAAGASSLKVGVPP